MQVPGRLIQLSPLNVRNRSVCYGECISNHYVFPEAEAGRGSALPLSPNLTAEQQQTGRRVIALPAFNVQIRPDQLALLEIAPDGPTRCRESAKKP